MLYKIFTATASVISIAFGAWHYLSENLQLAKQKQYN